MDEEEPTRSPEWLELLLGLSSGEIFLKLRAMHSVLEIQGPKDPIRVHHTSFTDYLFDPTRSGKFYIVGQQYVLAGRWAPALPREIQSGEFHIDDVTWRTVLAERWLQAITRIEIGEYSLDQLNQHRTNTLFTSFICFCASLPAPSLGLIDGLQNFDISALLFCLLALITYKKSLNPADGFTPTTWYKAFLMMVEERHKAEDILDRKGDKAQRFLDQFRGVNEVETGATGATRNKTRDGTDKLFWNLLPSYLRIQHGVTKLGDYPVGGGAFADVWRGKNTNQPGVCMALKVPKLSPESDLKQLQGDMIREVLVWAQLDHKNIAPFKGVCLLAEGPGWPCFVSPLMDQGDLVEFLKKNPSIDPELQYNLALDVASGLAYLHSRGIIHCDIRGVNILIDSENNACITDFDQSRITSITPTGHCEVEVRWLAPELLAGSGDASLSSDVYAYAYVCYEASQDCDYRYALLSLTPS
ncbi:hypothetical protein V5O48_018487 [Marasmius crinis-equi]|uniref:Protein kinase domain-containing protein n=1 Tax=Marasmius crinis-equi TaxID=585013 RepID=A0ABR3EL32_9AGAR